MRNIFLVIVVLCVSIFSYANEGVDAREVQNGGGGVRDNDGFKTFYSANIPVYPNALQLNEIPGMGLLVDNISNLMVSDPWISPILVSIFPHEDRKYYRVNQSELNDVQRLELNKIYGQQLGVNPDQVVIFAFTDPRSKNTFLLPSFFKLKESEQAAILFHESLWAYNPQLSYATVIESEQAAQAYFEQPESAQKAFTFYSRLGRIYQNRFMLISAVLSTGEFSVSDASKFPMDLNRLLGASFIKCSSQATGDLDDCGPTLLIWLAKSLRNQPSLTAQALFEFLSSSGRVSLRLLNQYDFKDKVALNRAWSERLNLGSVIWTNDEICYEVLDINLISVGNLCFRGPIPVMKNRLN